PRLLQRIQRKSQRSLRNQRRNQNHKNPSQRNPNKNPHLLQRSQRIQRNLLRNHNLRKNVSILHVTILSNLQNPSHPNNHPKNVNTPHVTSPRASLSLNNGNGLNHHQRS